MNQSNKTKGTTGYYIHNIFVLQYAPANFIGRRQVPIA